MDEINDLIADYCLHKTVDEKAYKSARIALMDALGCAILSLQFPECKKLLGPLVAGTIVPKGSRVPGTSFVLDPVTGAFNISCMIRWLDFNDTWLGKEWAHPSDNIGAILSVGDYLSQIDPSYTMRKILTAIIKAYEIQGIIALQNSFNSIGLDHVILVKIASAAVVTELLGGNKQQIMDALSHAWTDLGPLRTYRHAPNTGSRKSWAAGDQAARAVFLAMLTMRGERGYNSVLSTKKWGLFDVLFKGQPFILEKPFDSFVIENILFKVSYPAEFHAQTAVEAAITIHPQIKNRLNEISFIEIQTQEPAMRIINKQGVLNNPADRDHCLQYMVAIALIKGDLTEDDYKDESAAMPLIDTLRNKMRVTENSEFTKDYYDLKQRSIANAVTVHLQDGSMIGPVIAKYPLGHPLRRKEALPHLLEKFKKNISSHYSQEKVDEIITLFNDEKAFDNMRVCDFIAKFT